VEPVYTDQQHGEQTTQQACFASSAKVPAVVLSLADQPDAAFTAGDLGRIVAFFRAHGLKLVAPLHQQSCTLLPAGGLLEFIQSVAGCWRKITHCSSSRARSIARSEEHTSELQ